MNELGTTIPLRRRCYLSLKEIEGRFQSSITTKANKDRKMPVAIDTSFLEELEVEHHQDTTSLQDDEKSRPSEPDQVEAFEVIPCLRKKKKRNHHLWKKIHRKMVKLKIVLKTIAEDRIITNHQHLNHKSDDFNIVVPSLLNEEPIGDNIKSEEEVDNATHDDLEKIPKVPRVNKRKVQTSFLKVVLESGETEVTPATMMKTMDSSISPTIQSTSTGSGSSTMTPPVLVKIIADDSSDSTSHTSVPPIATLSLQSTNTSKNHMSRDLSAPTNNSSSCGSYTNSSNDTSTSSSINFSMEDTVRDVSARQDSDTPLTLMGVAVYTTTSATPIDGAVTRTSSRGIDNHTLISDSWNSYLSGLNFDHHTLVPGEKPIAPGCHVSWNDVTDLWETIIPCRSRQYHPPMHTTNSLHSMDSISALTDPFYSHNPTSCAGPIIPCGTRNSLDSPTPATFPSHIETHSKFSSSSVTTGKESPFPRRQFDKQTIGTDVTRVEI